MPTSYHIIIADDDVAVRVFLVRVIARIYPLATISDVSDGLDALTIYQQCGADLVMTNNEMPILSGLALIERLRRLSPTVPIIMSSGHPTVEPVARAAGATHFLSKPLSRADLIRIVTSILPP